MKPGITKLIYLSMAVFLIVGISGCTDSKSGIIGSNSISKSSVSSKLAASENSGIFSEYKQIVPRKDPSLPMGPDYGICGGKLTSYKATYNNGDTISIMWDNIRPPCDNKVTIINYNIKQVTGSERGEGYQVTYKNALGKPDQPDQYRGPSGFIYWTMDGRVDPTNSKGDINEANEFINLGKNKANEIVNRYNSGQLK